MSAVEAAVVEWHTSVNGGDTQRSAGSVGNPVVVLGPRGAGPITPGSAAPTRVATAFRVAGEKVTAVLRLPDLESALELASVCREMAATE